MIMANMGPRSVRGNLHGGAQRSNQSILTRRLAGLGQREEKNRGIDS